MMKISRVLFVKNVKTVFGMRYKGEEFSSPIPEDVMTEALVENSKCVKVFFEEEVDEIIPEENMVRNEDSVGADEVHAEEPVEDVKESSEKVVQPKKSGRPKKSK
jgi:hypothetical protein